MDLASGLSLPGTEYTSSAQVIHQPDNHIVVEKTADTGAYSRLV